MRIIFSAFCILAASLLILPGCAYITGESPTTSSLPTLPPITGTTTNPRWVWSTGSGDYSIIVDRGTHEPIRDVNVEEAFGIIGTSQHTENPVIIDVRTPEEYAGGYVRGAINIDYLSDSFRDDINRLDKSKLYIVYCRTGVRSSEARDIMEGSGFRHVINVTGGIADWQAAGFPVVK